MENKSKNFAKRVLKAYVVRDIGKVQKYEEKLDVVAKNLEVRVQLHQLM